MRLQDFIEVAFAYFDNSTKRKDDIMATIADVNTKVSELSAKVDALVAKFADEKVAIAAAADAQKVADAAAEAAELDGVVAALVAVEAKVS